MKSVDNMDSVESILKSLAKDNRLKKEKKTENKEEKKSLFGKKAKKTSIYLEDDTSQIENNSDMDDENECIFNEDMEIGDITLRASAPSYEFGADEEIVEETVDIQNMEEDISDVKNSVDSPIEIEDMIEEEILDDGNHSQIELEKKDIDESDNEMESRLFDSDETDIVDSNMLEDMGHLDDFDDEIVGSQFESDDFSEDLFADLPILSKFQNFDDMDDSTEGVEEIKEVNETRNRDDTQNKGTDDILDSLEEDLAEDVDGFETNDMKDIEIPEDSKDIEKLVGEEKDLDINDREEKNTDINIESDDNINKLEEEDEKFKNCIFYAGMSIEDYLRKNPKYREKLYVEHFFKKDFLDKMLKSGMILFSKGCYRL